MKEFFEKFKIRDKGTMIRTILQILVYINQLVAAIGQTSFANNPVYQWISFGLTVVVTGFTYWYNNNWTKMAELGQEVYEMVKDGSISAEEMQKFLDEHKKPEELLPSEEPKGEEK